MKLLLFYFLLTTTVWAQEIVYVNGVPIEVNSVKDKNGVVHIEVKEDYFQCFLENDLETKTAQARPKRTSLSTSGRSGSKRGTVRKPASTLPFYTSNSSSGVRKFTSNGTRRFSSGKTQRVVSESPSNNGSSSRASKRARRTKTIRSYSLRSVSSPQASVTRSPKEATKKFKRGARNVDSLSDASDEELKKYGYDPSSEKSQETKPQQESLNYQ